jgi:hypothetical protein
MHEFMFMGKMYDMIRIELKLFCALPNMLLMFSWKRVFTPCDLGT